MLCKNTATSLCLMAFLLLPGCRNIPLEETRAKMEKNLKTGDPEEKVRMFLRENSIEENGEVQKYTKNNAFDSMNLLFHDRDKHLIDYYFDAAIRDTSSSFMVSCGHYMRFFFNAEKKLEGHVVEKICTGP